ncbi:aminotransferase class III-fold pyridoxal phosphate-dependent enzyme [Bradyrhizobium sp. USDA 336]|uniref:aminotransferase class III-fold pyridoxal phosphate-dependent enzyme n=1 Tax=Bradyrhizobium sp. USDA 336 TaxID=3156311 RepID=UPI0038338736
MHQRILASSAAILGRQPHQQLRTISRAEGFALIDTSGKRYTDGISGAYAAVLGYSEVDLAECLFETSSLLPYVHSARFDNAYAVSLADKLSGSLHGVKYRAYFSVSGSDGVEAALRIARSYQHSVGSRRRWRTIALSYSYHGSTLGALTVTGHETARRSYTELLGDVIRIAPPIKALTAGSAKNENDRPYQQLENAFEEPLVNDVAAFVIEPVLGNAAGCSPIPQDYAERVSALCHRHRILLICDEITTGLWRTGPVYSSERLGMKPDILILGKAITAGYFPMSVVLVADHIAEALTAEVNLLGHTHSAHPVGAALGSRVIEHLKSPGISANRAQLERVFFERLSSLVGVLPVVGVRGAGLLYSVCLDHDYFQKRCSRNGSSIVYEQALEAGILTMPGVCASVGGQVLSDHLTLAPAFNMPQQTLHDFVDTLTGVLGAA